MRNEQCSYVEIYFCKKMLFHIIEDHHTREKNEKSKEKIRSLFDRHIFSYAGLFFGKDEEEY